MIESNSQGRFDKTLEFLAGLPCASQVELLLTDEGAYDFGLALYKLSLDRELGKLLGWRGKHSSEGITSRKLKLLLQWLKKDDRAAEETLKELLERDVNGVVQDPFLLYEVIARGLWRPFEPHLARIPDSPLKDLLKGLVHNNHQAIYHAASHWREYDQAATQLLFAQKLADLAPPEEALEPVEAILESSPTHGDALYTKLSLLNKAREDTNAYLAPEYAELAEWHRGFRLYYFGLMKPGKRGLAVKTSARMLKRYWTLASTAERILKCAFSP